MSLSELYFLLTVDKIGHFHQVRHRSLICVFYDQPAASEDADVPILQKFRDAFGGGACDYVTLGTKSIVGAVPLFRVLGKYLRIDHYNVWDIITKRQESCST